MATEDEARSTWDALARKDAFGAILTDPNRCGGGWTPEEFFATGEREIEIIDRYLASLHMHPDHSGEALDFGCGVGRLTRALAGRFTGALGLDVSPVMIDLACQWNPADSRIRFLVNDGPAIAAVPDGAMSFVYSSIVLQHIKPKLALGYIREFLRVLAPRGICVFQTLDRRPQHGAWIRLRSALRPRTRLKSLLHKIRGEQGSAEEPRFEMLALPEREVRAAVERAGGSILDTRFTNSVEPAFNGDLRLLDEAPSSGWISRLYVVGHRSIAR